jgi:nucleoside-diphosphate-sugar epimerase
MKTVLITGSTGFLGSSLAARFLKDGHRVIALSRQDPQGSRTLKVIEDSAAGFGEPLSEEQKKNLKVLDAQWAFADENTLEMRESQKKDLQAALLEVELVWHCAAEMSFSFRKYLQSYETNTRLTQNLYHFTKKFAPQAKRFFYVSTAYVSGLEQDSIAEQVHTAPKFVNPYQISKWCTEMNLKQLSEKDSSLPVTLYRPAIVVGHSKTGWYGGKCFGLYMFVDGWRLGLALGSRSLRVDVKPHLKQNFVTIDEVIENAFALSFHLNEQRAFDIAHCAGTPVVAKDTVAVASRILGFKASFGPPRRPTDFLVDRFVSANKPFAVANDFPFEQKRLQEILGDQWQQRKIDSTVMRTLIEGYLDQKGAFEEGSISSVQKSFLFLYRKLNAQGVGRYIDPKLGKTLGETMLGKVMLPMVLQK